MRDFNYKVIILIILVGVFLSVFPKDNFGNPNVEKILTDQQKYGRFCSDERVLTNITKSIVKSELTKIHDRRHLGRVASAYAAYLRSTKSNIKCGILLYVEDLSNKPPKVHKYYIEFKLSKKYLKSKMSI